MYNSDVMFKLHNESWTIEEVTIKTFMIDDSFRYRYSIESCLCVRYLANDRIIVIYQTLPVPFIFSYIHRIFAEYTAIGVLLSL